MSFSQDNINPMTAGAPPSPDIDTAQPPMASSPAGKMPPAAGMPLAQPSAPQASQQPQPRPSAPPSPAEQHASIYQKVFGMLSGGGNRPVMGPNGQPQTDANGQVIMKQAGVKQLGAGILAGALSSMIAGMATPTQYQTIGGSGGYQRHVADNSGAMAAGANAAQPFTQAGQQQKAQGQADADTNRAYSVVDHNMKMHAMLIANDKADRENQQAGVDTYSPYAQALSDANANGEGADKNGNPLIAHEDVSADELQKMLHPTDGSMKVDMHSVFPSRVVSVPNEDGKGTHTETLFTIYNMNAAIGLTDKLREDNPSLASVPKGTSVPLIALAKLYQQKMDGQLAASGWSDKMDEYNKSNGIKGDAPALSAAAKANPLIAKLYPLINKYSSEHLPEFFKDMEANPAANPTAVRMLMKAYGVTPAGLQKVTDTITADKKAGERGPDAMPADPTTLANFKTSKATEFPNLTSGQINSVYEGLGKNPTVADLSKAENKIIEISKSNQAAKMADQGMDEKQQKMLLDYGVAGDKRLTLDNAPDEMLVNQHTGNPIPNKSLTAVKASQTEVNRAQFATSVLHLADALKKAQDAGNLPNAPLVGGITNQILSKAGLTSEEAQKAMTEISLLQSAATGAHVGGRFSVPVLEKMNKLLSLNMNDAQFRGTLEAITDTMQNYKDNGGRFTVAEWRQLDPKERQRLMGHDEPTPKSNPQPHAPAGAMGTQKFDDGKGNIADYYVDAQGKPLGRK